MEVTRRRTASELFVLGVPIVLDDGGTDWEPKVDDDGNKVLDSDGNEILVEVALPPVTLWIAKLNDLEMDTASKKAARSQAKVMATRQQHDTDGWQTTHSLMSMLSHDELVATLLEKEMGDPVKGVRRQMIEARIVGTPDVDENGEDQPNEWAKDGYVEGLRAAWLDGLNATYAADPEDPEASRVLAEIQRFVDLVDNEWAFEADVERNLIDGLPEEVLLEKVTDFITESEGQEAWAEEYKKWCVVLAARDCDGPDPDRPGKCLCRGSRRKHTEFHFKGGYDEVTGMDGSVRNYLYAAYNAVTVDVREGKGSRAARRFSTPSGLSDAEAISDSSGPETATE